MGFLLFGNFQPVQDNSLNNGLVQAVEEPALGRDTTANNQIPGFSDLAGATIQAPKIPAPKGTAQQDETKQQRDACGGGAQCFHDDRCGTLQMETFKNGCHRLPQNWFAIAPATGFDSCRRCLLP